MIIFQIPGEFGQIIDSRFSVIVYGTVIRDDAVLTLVSFYEFVNEVQYSRIERVKRFVFGIRFSLEVFDVCHVSGLKHFPEYFFAFFVGPFVFGVRLHGVVMIKQHKIVKPLMVTLKKIRDQKNKVLIVRSRGGLGDILMQRMLFENFKILMRDVDLTFACPAEYRDAVIDHPFIDAWLPSRIVTHVENGVRHEAVVVDGDFLRTYDTSRNCNEWELAQSENRRAGREATDLHRAEIWARGCGVPMVTADMHIRFTDGERGWARDKLAGVNPDGRKTVLLAPVSRMESKNLHPHQLQPVIDELSRDYYVFVLHDRPTPQFAVPCLSGVTIRQWMSIIEAVDYVISVDTAAFHCAGGLGKPTVAVFGWADSKVYSKFYKNVARVQRHRDDDPTWTCGPCYNFNKCTKDLDGVRKPCITELTAADILRGFRSLV